MTLKRIVWVGVVLLCLAIGFVLAQQYERNRNETRLGAFQAQQNEQLARVRNEADARVDAMARTQGELVLQAFSAGISSAVLAGRRESVETAAVSMLHVPGIAGIHVLKLDGSVIYSSDAKLSATGEGGYRGSWALGVTGLVTRPSTRPDVLDIALPIMSANAAQAVVWLEFDIASAKNAAASPRPDAIDAPTDAAAPSPSPQNTPIEAEPAATQ